MKKYHKGSANHNGHTLMFGGMGEAGEEVF